MSTTTNRLERAQHLLRSSAKFAALAAIPLAASAPAHASVTGWHMSTSSLTGLGGASGGAFTYPSAFTQAQLGLTGIKISGNAGPLTGGTFLGNNLALTFTGINTETVLAGQTILSEMDMLFGVDGGEVRVLRTYTEYRDTASSGLDYVSGEVLYPGGEPVGLGGAFIASFFTGALPHNFGFSTWEFTLEFQWLNAGDTGFLSITVPANSIDLRVVPMPATVGLLLVGATLASRRRR